MARAISVNPSLTGHAIHNNWTIPELRILGMAARRRAACQCRSGFVQLLWIAKTSVARAQAGSRGGSGGSWDNPRMSLYLLFLGSFSFRLGVKLVARPAVFQWIIAWPSECGRLDFLVITGSISFIFGKEHLNIDVKDPPESLKIIDFLPLLRVY